MGASYQESTYFIPINTIGDGNSPIAYSLSALALFLEDGLQAKSSAFTLSGSKLSRNNSNRGQWMSHHRFSLICVKHTNRLRKGSNKITRHYLKKKKGYFLLHCPWLWLILPQLHTPRHQGHAALNTVLLFVTAENFLQCHPWSCDMEESQHLLFPSDIQHFLSNMQFRKHILVKCFMSSDIRRSVSRATWLLWLTGILLSTWESLAVQRWFIISNHLSPQGIASILKWHFNEHNSLILL